MTCAKFWLWIVALLVADSVRAALVTLLIFHRIQLAVWGARWEWQEIARVTVVPLAEELLFRGVLVFAFLLLARCFLGEQQKDEGAWSWSAGVWCPVIVAQAVLFAALHDDYGVMVNAWFGGMLYGFVFWKTQSLVPGILGHAWFNFLATVLPG
jgi:membrane protease YdiL (CAAX protease family)